jgi:hypothetical protein
MIKIFPDAHTASVRVDLSTGRAASLFRTDRNGTAPVRLKASQYPDSSMTVRDYEAALSGRIVYTLKTLEGEETSETALDGTLSQHVTKDHLTNVRRPEQRFIPELTLGYEPTRETKSTVHEIIGRSTPLVVQGPMGARRGTLELLALDADAADQIDALQATEGPFLYRFAGGGPKDFYFEPTSVSPSYDGGRWRVRIEFVEVARPTFPLVGGTGLTYRQVRERNATFADVQAKYPTYRDMQVAES